MACDRPSWKLETIIFSLLSLSLSCSFFLLDRFRVPEDTLQSDQTRRPVLAQLSKKRTEGISEGDAARIRVTDLPRLSVFVEVNVAVVVGC